MQFAPQKVAYRLLKDKPFHLKKEDIFHKIVIPVFGGKTQY